MGKGSDSLSLPLLFPEVYNQGGYLQEGGIRESISISRAGDPGGKKNLWPLAYLTGSLGIHPRMIKFRLLCPKLI